MRRPHPPRTGARARHRRGRGRRSATSRERNPDVDGHGAALRQRARPRRRHGVHPDVRAAAGADGARLRPAAPVRPRGRRRPRARARRASTSRPGVYNVAADGVLALSEVIGLLGKRAAAGPAAVGHRACSRARCGGSGFRIPDEMRQPAAVRARGRQPRSTRRPGSTTATRRARPCCKLGEHLRLRPVMRGVEHDVHLRARGRGVPALEPARAPRAARRARRRRRGPRAARDLSASARRRSQRASAGCEPAERRDAPRACLHSSIGHVGRRAQIALAAVAGVAARRWRSPPTRSTAPTRTRSPTGVRVGGVDVGGLSADQAAHAAQREARRSRSTSRSRSTFEGTKYILSPDRLQLHADVDGMVDAALGASRSGRPSDAGLALRDRRRRSIARSRRRSATRPTRSTASSTRSPSRSTARPRTRPSSPAPARSTRSPGKDGVTVVTDELRSRAARRDREPAPPDRRRPPVERVKPQVTTDQLAAEVPDLPHHRPRHLPAPPVEEPEARQDLHDRGRPGRASRRPPAPTRSTTSRSTRPGTSPTPPGPATSPAR